MADDSKKSKEELLAELQEMRRRLAARAEDGGTSTERPRDPIFAGDIDRRTILKTAWVAPVILSLPMGAGIARAQVPSLMPSVPSLPPTVPSPPPTMPPSIPPSVPPSPPPSIPPPSVPPSLPPSVPPPSVPPSAPPSLPPSVPPSTPPSTPPSNPPTTPPTLTPSTPPSVPPSAPPSGKNVPLLSKGGAIALGGALAAAAARKFLAPAKPRKPPSDGS